MIRAHLAAEARGAEIHAAADQKRALLVAEEALQVHKQAAADQKRALLLVENESLKSQIISELLDDLRPSLSSI